MRINMEKSEIRNQVEEFMLAAKQNIANKPTIPEDKIARLRAKLIFEEAIEFLEATYGSVFSYLRYEVMPNLDTLPLNIDIVEIADATLDLDYVSEGARLAYGINGKPLADEVHQSNMAKFGPGSYVREDGKLMKPPGWTAPNIEELLKEQSFDL
jgi:predicted HAD superfamily Cof-like phosphohydrolase